MIYSNYNRFPPQKQGKQHKKSNKYLHLLANAGHDPIQAVKVFFHADLPQPELLKQRRNRTSLILAGFYRAHAAPYQTGNPQRCNAAVEMEAIRPAIQCALRFAADFPL